MDYNKLAELLFPHIDKTPEYYEEHFPKRVLPEGAKVTRLDRRLQASYTLATCTAHLPMKDLRTRVAESFISE